MSQSSISGANNATLGRIIQEDRLKNHSITEAISTISESSNEEELHLALLATLQYLSSLEDLSQEIETSQLTQLTSSITGLLTSKFRTTPGPSPPTLLIEAALACLALLSSTPSKVDHASILNIIAYTDPHDPWTTSESAESAKEVLARQLTSDEKRAFITDHILQGFLKPLFSHSSTRVTASGRPSHYPTPPTRHRPLSEKPFWKQESPWAVAVIRWTVTESDPQLIKNQWPLFTPVLLALAEDEEPAVKARGLEILAQFIEACPSEVLWTTGIGQIFQDVAFPALLHLPGINSEAESNQILTPAYEVLTKLAEAHPDQKNPDRRRLLDKVLRDGIFDGYQHASQHAQVVETLIHYAISIINALGIYSTKHLQSLLSIISSIMTDPFALAHPPSVLAAAKAQNALICNCWPRLLESGHAEQIIQNTALCWLELHDDESTSHISREVAREFDEELMRTSRMLQALWLQHSQQPPEKLAEAIEREPRLGKLFSPAVGAKPLQSES